MAELIYSESYQYGFDPELILALVVKESSIYNWSKSRVGALGLMQIRPTTGRALAKAINIPWNGKKTLFKPHLNIKLGTHYLAKLVDRFGKIEVALTAYNYGPTRVARMLKKDQTLPKAYAHRILGTYQRFKELNQIQLVESWDPNDPVQTWDENGLGYLKV
jgi:soluble lytic murein transglycosylase